MRRALFAMWIAIICGCEAGGRGGVSRVEIRIAAATDLVDALPKLLRAHAADSSCEVIPTFGSSGQLAAQIRQGAPFDLYLSADRKLVADLADAGIIRRESMFDYARGTLTIVTSANCPTKVTDIADLADVRIKRIAIANPEHAPYGVAARDLLERAGIWADLSPRMVFAENVRQALTFAETGDVDAAIVATALVRGKSLRRVAVDPSRHAPIVHTMGIVADSKHRAEAEAIATFLRGDRAKSILREFGFLDLDGTEGERGAPSRGMP
jgi:molybdate transport system substrate-binding protein